MDAVASRCLGCGRGFNCTIDKAERAMTFQKIGD
jgi:hypothetical protein